MSAFGIESRIDASEKYKNKQKIIHVQHKH